MSALLIAFSFASFFKGVLLFFFVVSGLLLTLVVLLQEPKGGGLSSAFGGAGAETFGVQTGGVNKFTTYVATIFMATAILYAAIRPDIEAAPTDRTRATPEKMQETPDETPPNQSNGSGSDEPGEPAPPGEEKK